MAMFCFSVGDGQPLVTVPIGSPVLSRTVAPPVYE